MCRSNTCTLHDSYTGHSNSLGISGHRQESEKTIVQEVSLSRWLYLTWFVAAWEALFKASKNNQGMPDMNINVVPFCGHRLVKSVAFHF